MSNNYQVVYSGDLVQGIEIDVAKRNVAALFKSTEDKIAPLFSGKRVIVKKGLDQATAEKYKMAMQKAGAICQVELMDATPIQQPVLSPVQTTETSTSGPTTSENVQATPVEETSLDSVTIDPPGTVIIEPELVEAVNIDTSDMSMGEAGEVIMESVPIQPPDIDTSSLAMDEPGVDLVETEQVTPVDIDTSTLDMAAAGEVIIKPEPVEPANIDTSGLDMAEPGEVILEKEDEELPPPPKTDGLSLES